MSERFENIEQSDLSSASTSEQEIRKMIEKGNYKEALDVAKTTQDPALLKQIEYHADEKLREISPEKVQESDLSVEDAETITDNAIDEKIGTYGEKHSPTFKTLKELRESTLESDEVLDELQNAINEAKSEATRSMIAKPGSILMFPFLGSVYGLFKGRKLRKALKRIEELHYQLKKNGGPLNQYLQEDKISPNKGHYATLISDPLMVAGIATAPIAPLSIPLFLSGAASKFVGIFRSISGYRDVKATRENLEKLSQDITKARGANEALKTHIGIYESSYKEGAKENLKEQLKAA